MSEAGDVAFRTLRMSAALVLCIVSVACDSEVSAPNGEVAPTQPSVLRIARARVVDIGDSAIPAPPGVAAWSTAGVADPLNMAFEANGNRLWIYEASTQQLIETSAGPDGRANLQSFNRVDARSLGLRAPQGVTVDPASGRLFLLDAGPRIVRMDPHPVLGVQRSIVSVIDLAPAGLSRGRGIAFDPTSGHLHVMDPVAQRLYEISQKGQIVATRDVSEFDLRDIEAMTFGPSGDGTDDESAMGLYIAAGGRTMELSLIQLAAAPAPAGAATLVRTTQTSQYSPPSPDPSGIAYISHLSNLIIVDGEVEEMSIYAGANVFETTRAGALTRSWTTTSFSIEPVGAAYNPANRHLFISDDDARQIFEIDPGADGRYGTADDRMTSFDTVVFGCTDPEGVAYDVAQRVLFIADGLNANVWRVSPGPNGVFDGVSPAGDDQVTTFDTQVHGLVDPEGIAYDSDFGHIYVSGKPANLLFHFNATGGLIRTIDISAANADKAAGLEYAPGSANAAVKTLYIVDRGVDNDSDPTENDGKMYEFSLPPFSGNVLPTVTITAPADGMNIIQGDAITFTGTASDFEDGNLTASLSWNSSLDGALGSGGSVSTTSLSVGTHTITASVTDSDGGQGSDAVTVMVSAPGLTEARVIAGPDDAEESNVGKVSLSSSDLELVVDGTIAQTVGLRFRGVTVPKGATIARAYVQFQVDERSSDVASLTIRGQATDNAPAFVNATGNISSRSRTAAAVSWSPAAWTTVGQAGLAQQTASIKSIIQEIVNRSGWSSGNALALIMTGTGRRTAVAYEGVPAAAPLLHIEYSTGPNTAPTATNVTISGTAQVGKVLTGNYTYNDADGDSEGTSTYRWLRNGAPVGGATTRTYTATAADEGTLLRFEVTPVAATGVALGTPVQSAEFGPITAPPPNTVPSASNVAIAGTAQVGKVLTGNYTYGDADADAEGASTYRWLREGVAIIGATARTYTLAAADEGTLIRFEVTPVAATGASPGAAVQSSAVGPIAPANSAPVASSVSITGTPQVGQVLTGNYTYSDAEGDAEGSSTYRWIRAGAPISGATARTYTLVAADQGALIRFEVRPVAVTGTSPGSAVQSPAVGPVTGTSGTGVVQVRVSAASDDAEESATGALSTGSSDLELVFDGSNQLVGMRFNAVSIPAGATITSASVQFQVDQATSGATSLTIRGEAADNAATFNGTTGKISVRPLTASAVTWSPAAWATIGQAGADQQTPNLASIIQEIVNRPGWISGNSVVIIISGTGQRVAEAYNGLPAAAPLLRVEYSTGGATAP